MILRRKSPKLFFSKTVSKYMIEHSFNVKQKATLRTASAYMLAVNKSAVL